MSLNRQNGALRWDTQLNGPILASPVVVNGTVYLGAADKHLYALDAATGRHRWAFATQDWIVSAVAYAGDRVIVASQDSRLHVVSAETGRRRLLYETGIGRHIGAAPAVQGDRAYFCSVGGRVWAIDWQATTYPLERGLLFWQTNLYVWGMLSTSPVQKGSVWSKRVGGDVRNTPALAHDMVYVPNAQGKVIALDAATGTERWQASVGVSITAAPTVAGSTVLIGTNQGWSSAWMLTPERGYGSSKQKERSPAGPSWQEARCTSPPTTVGSMPSPRQSSGLSAGGLPDPRGSLFHIVP